MEPREPQVTTAAEPIKRCRHRWCVSEKDPPSPLWPTRYDLAGCLGSPHTTLLSRVTSCVDKRRRGATGDDEDPLRKVPLCVEIDLANQSGTFCCALSPNPDASLFLKPTHSALDRVCVLWRWDPYRPPENGSLASTSRPTRPAVGQWGSSPGSRMPRWSRRSSPTWMRKRLSPKARGGRRAGRRSSGGCSTKGDYPTDPVWAVTSAAQPRWRSARWQGPREKHAGEPVAGVDSDAVTPLRGDRRVGATADRRCRHRWGETAGRRKRGLYWLI